jgi:branched-chain amino acid aminotransferase
MIEKQKKIWFDGKFVDWDDANVHILTHTLHYGLGVFEGIRAYELNDGSSAIFRHKEHVIRLFRSAHIMTIEIPYSQEEIIEATKELLRINGLKHGYIRPLVFMGAGEMGLYATGNKVQVAIITWPWGTYLGEEGVKNGIRAKISSYTRHHVNITLSKAKAVSNYVNSILAKREALNCGYEEALLMDPHGFVVEGTGENVFLVRDGIVHTPPLSHSVLEGITRDAVMTILKDNGIPLRENLFSRDEVYVADELFLTGTAAEITPIREVDNRQIGSGQPGPITKKIQDIFFKILKGTEKRYAEWLDRY